MDAADCKRLVYKYRWAMFAILAVTYFFVYFHRMSVNALGTDMVADVGSGSKESPAGSCPTVSVPGRHRPYSWR